MILILRSVGRPDLGYRAYSRVLLSTACPTSLASDPNIRGGRSGVQTAPACGAAFGGIDNDQPEIKARQRPSQT